MSFMIPFDFHQGDRLDSMTIVTPIVRGGHGDLYLVSEDVEQKKVLKVIRKADNEGELTGIEKCRAVSSHIPGLVPVLRVGKLPDGRIWCVMPAADNLARWPDYEPDTLAARIGRDGRLPPEEVLNLADKLLATVRDLHETGLAHCDIKPENIVFLDGEPRLTDYSLLSGVRNRPAGASFGTIGFVPPEMIENPARYDGKAGDLYAIGKIVFCAWSGTDAAMFPSVPRDIPLREIGLMLPLYMKACSGSPNERFKSADEFIAAVGDARSRLHCRFPAQGRVFLKKYAWIVLLILILVPGMTFLANSLFLSFRRPADDENGPFVVTTARDVMEADDDVNSLREALAHARAESGIRTISFNMPDGDEIKLDTPNLITRDMRFAPVNKATGRPASIVLDHLTLSEQTLSTPEGWEGGGAVLCANGGNFTVSGGLYTGNMDHGFGGVGGAFRAVNGTLAIDGATFKRNAAYSAGGAVSVKNATLTIRKSYFEGNYTVGFGGAVDLDRSTALISDTTFLLNNTQSNPHYHWMGGAIQVNASDLVYEVTEGKTITDAGNDSGFGGFIALRGTDGKAAVEFRVDGTLNIGKGDGRDAFCSLYEEKKGPDRHEKDMTIRKTGGGVMTIDAPVSDYNEPWILEDGVLAFVYAPGGDFDGAIMVSGGQLRLDAPYRFKSLTFRLGAKPNGRVFIRGFSNLNGGTFRIDADGAGNGVYPLAEGADGFDGTILLRDASGESSSSGTPLSVGRTVNAGKNAYTLDLTDGLLTLTVTSTRN